MSLKKAVSKVLALATCFGLVMGSSMSVMAATIDIPGGQSTLGIDENGQVVDGGTVINFDSGINSGGTIGAVNINGQTITILDMVFDGTVSVWQSGYTLCFDGENYLNMIVPVAPYTLDVTAGSSLTVSSWYVDDTVTISSGVVTDPSELEDGEEAVFTRNGSASSSSSSSSEEASSSESSAAASEAEVPIPAPVPTFCNNTVTMADGSKVESAVAGQFVSAEAVALVPAGAAKDLKPDTPVLAPLSVSFRAAVSDVNAANSPASTATLKAFETATGLSTACALNVNLVDSATTSLATHNAWSAVDNTAGTYAFPAISGGQLTTLYANEAALMVVNLAEGEGDNAMVVGVTSGGTAFVQNDLDTNPDTATFMVLPGSGVYGVLS